MRDESSGAISPLAPPERAPGASCVRVEADFEFFPLRPLPPPPEFCADAEIEDAFGESSAIVPPEIDASGRIESKKPRKQAAGEKLPAISASCKNCREKREREERR